jgi:hypothetical protein
MAAVVPTVAFYLAVVIGVAQVEYKSISVGGLIAAFPLYLVFVGLPSMFPFAVARHGWVRAMALLVMCATAAAAGALVATTDDAQAGLAVFIVWYVGVPLGATILVGQAIASRRHALGDRP